MARQLSSILIEPKLQGRLILYFVAVFILTTTSFYATGYFFFWRLQQKALQVGIPKGHVFFEFLGNLKYDFDILFFALGAVNFLIIFYFGLKVSHRIAGPFYKMKKYLSDIHSHPEPFALRKNDFFKDIEPLINKIKSEK
ncbi:MAG: hypothetical protein H7235_09390 [Bdellovibrionaceae bacterium]|nr:hypothetical protein [Pseudobdellovibrionaceae bacterium]